MKDFKDYLEQKNLAEKNIDRRIRLVKKWLKWLPKKVERSNYQDLLNYIKKLQEEEKTISHINAVLLGISDYYDHKKLPNIAINTRLKGQVTKAMSNPLTSIQLESIYNSFEGNELEKIILGLMIYQGFEQSDFMMLEIKDINLKKGTVYIPSRKERKSRTLRLESHQMMALQTFIFSTERTSEKAFSPYNDNPNHFSYLLSKLSKKLKQQSQENLGIEIVKLSHLRQSRIAIWVKEQGIRKSQYMAGFRRVLSAEKYRKLDLTDLKNALQEHHPLK